MLFAVVDIETTGGSARMEGITEVAVVVHDGEQILETFETLVNPQTGIPTYITGLTGIDNQMVRNAPTFEEIAEDLFDVLKDKIFVAHNVNFDYNFLRESFNRAGITFSSQKLCTVRLGRKIFPGYRSYSLGRLCESRGIKIEARHRAMGDAKATAILFGQMMRENEEIIFKSLKRNIGEAFLPPNFPKAKFDKIPQECGVYYMLNEKGKVIYVGKAINIRERFKSHFSGNLLPKIKDSLKSEIVDLKWELTGTEFFALLFETLEIKRLWPKYNSALKRPKRLWGLFQFEDGNGYQRFQIAPVRKGILPLETFFSHDEALEFTRGIISKFELCEKLCGLRKVNCKKMTNSVCGGACTGEIKPENYNQRVAAMLSSLAETKGEISIELEAPEDFESVECVFENGILSKYIFRREEKPEDTGFEWTVVPRIPETFYILRRFIHTLRPESIKVLAS